MEHAEGRNIFSFAFALTLLLESCLSVSVCVSCHTCGPRSEEEQARPRRERASGTRGETATNSLLSCLLTRPHNPLVHKAKLLPSFFIIFIGRSHHNPQISSTYILFFKRLIGLYFCFLPRLNKIRVRETFKRGDFERVKIADELGFERFRDREPRVERSVQRATRFQKYINVTPQ